MVNDNEIEFIENKYQASLIFDFNGHAHTYNCEHVTAYLPGTECVILPILDGFDDYFLVLRSDNIENLKDDEILRLVKQSNSLAILLGHKKRLRWVIEKKDPLLGIYSIEDLKKEVQPSVDALCDYLIKNTDTETVELITAYNKIVAGQHPASGYVYCLSDQLGHYKIGYSRQLNSRIKQLSTQPPFSIELIAAHLVYDMRQYEAALHWVFQQKRLRGEWFSLTPEDVERFVSRQWVSTYINLKAKERRGENF